MSLAPPLILICDHRGEGLSEALAPLAGGAGGVGPLWRLLVTSQLRSTRQALAENEPAVIVLDPLAEGGRAELEAIDALQDGRAAPVLLVADPLDPLAAVTAARTLARGPNDVVHRGAPLAEFVLRIERLHATHQGQSEIAKLRHAALHDDRTDLLRPKAFQLRLGEHFSAAERHHLDLVLVLIDLDDFGRVNKAFDHTVGDLVITKVGEVIRNTLRTEDVAGRLGGDEFAVLLPYTERLDGAHVVRRLRDEIHGLPDSLRRIGDGLEVSASLGFETFDGSDIDTVETLRLHAELALREAKNLGGNRGVYYRSLRIER